VLDRSLDCIHIRSAPSVNGGLADQKVSDSKQFLRISSVTFLRFKPYAGSSDAGEATDRRCAALGVLDMDISMGNTCYAFVIGRKYRDESIFSFADIQ
jgi:hypothetical protein